jgi:uncharacterized protein YndB with AHSA1/START domain
MKTFKLRETIKALPADVYAALTNKHILEIWTGENAEMVAEPNTEFSWFDGDICGKNIEFEPNKRIVQLWYFGENEQSTVTINIFPDKKGTQIEVLLSDIPEEAVENLTEGWKETIFASLKDLLEE